MVSDYDPSPVGGDPSPFEGGPETDLGGATSDGQTTDQPAYEEPKNYLNVDEVADRYVRVKVDGEEIEVPVQEALQGYSRTADYTRKTQELAQQRQQAEYALAVQAAHDEDDVDLADDDEDDLWSSPSPESQSV